MKTELIVDGSQGEGGGQILRSSVGLSALTGRPVRIVKVRAGRKKPGLLRQHLTALLAAAEVCEASVEGAELGSPEVLFTPGRPRAGRYTFSVGTAGSASLVCQTVLPLLLRSGGEIEVSGGTHNPLAPPYDFLEHVYLPLLRKMGVNAESELTSVGFYPAGGGRIRVRVSSPAKLAPLELLQWVEEPDIEAWGISSQVPPHVAERELQVIRDELGVPSERTRSAMVRSTGPGNAVCIRIGDYELVTAFGERGVPAEEVARKAVTEARAYLSRRAPVGEHLADQLILPFALAGGTFRTGPLSSHALTNIAVVRAFLGADAVHCLSEAGGEVCLRFPGRVEPR